MISKSDNTTNTTNIMNNMNPTLSFGRYLQAIRIEKEISINAISKITKIRKDLLIKIEEEDFNGLPDIVFMKGFLRAYAKVIDADADVAIDLYLARLNVARKITKAEADLARFSNKYWLRLMFSFMVFFGVIGMTVYALSYLRDTPDTDKPEVSQVQDEKDNKEGAYIFSEPTDPKLTETEKNSTVPERYYLQIKTVEETWIKIAVDENEANEYNLNPGDYMELEALSGFNLLVGNAGGVNLTLNGKLLKMSGKSGQVVNVRIPDK